MKKIKTAPNPLKPYVSDEFNYYKGGWSVHDETGRFYFRFVSAGHGGDLQQFEIIEGEYNSAREGTIGSDFFYNKYGRLQNT